MMMDCCASTVQQKDGYASCREDVAMDYVVCPKPRRSKAATDLLDIILSKSVCCAQDYEQTYAQQEWQPSVFNGSPPSRVSNPLIQDSRFVQVEEENYLVPSFAQLQHPNLNLGLSNSLSSRKGGLARSNFGNKPAVRVEGFEALDRDGRNCSIFALA